MSLFKTGFLRSLIVGFGLTVGVVLAVSIDSNNIWNTNASNGDVITASAWNELVSKAKSFGSACISEGQSSCLVPSSNVTWNCSNGYVWSGSVKNCVTQTFCPKGVSSCTSTPAKSCNWFLTNGYNAGDGVYWVSTNVSSTPFKVYCDMTTDGGGWTKIVGINPFSGFQILSAETPFTSFSTGSYGKYSDSVINSIGTKVGGSFQFRFTCSTITYYINDPIWDVTTNASRTYTYSSGYNSVYTSFTSTGGGCGAQWCTLDSKALYYGYAGDSNGCGYISRNKSGSVYIK